MCLRIISMPTRKKADVNQSKSESYFFSANYKILRKLSVTKFQMYLIFDAIFTMSGKIIKFQIVLHNVIVKRLNVFHHPKMMGFNYHEIKPLKQKFLLPYQISGRIFHIKQIFR